MTARTSIFADGSRRPPGADEHALPCVFIPVKASHCPGAKGFPEGETAQPPAAAPLLRKAKKLLPSHRLTASHNTHRPRQSSRRQADLTEKILFAAGSRFQFGAKPKLSAKVTRTAFSRTNFRFILYTDGRKCYNSLTKKEREDIRWIRQFYQLL